MIHNYKLHLGRFSKFDDSDHKLETFGETTNTKFKQSDGEEGLY